MEVDGIPEAVSVAEPIVTVSTQLLLLNMSMATRLDSGGAIVRDALIAAAMAGVLAAAF